LYKDKRKKKKGKWGQLRPLIELPGELQGMGYGSDMVQDECEHSEQSGLN